MLLCVVSVILVVYVGLQLKTPVYEAQVKMLISAEKQVESPYYKEMGNRNNEAALTQSEIVKSTPVIERAVESLNLHLRPSDYERKFSSPLKQLWIDYRIGRLKQEMNQVPAEASLEVALARAIKNLRERITVQPVRDTNVFTITVSDFDPKEAARIANVVSRSYVIFDLEQQLAELALKYGSKHPMVNQLSNSISKMNQSLTGDYLSDLDAIGPASVKIIEQAILPLKPQGPNKTVLLMVAFFMSSFLGVMLAFIFEYFDQTIKSPGELAQLLDLPLLGSIPQKRIWQKAFIKGTPGILQNSMYFSAYRNLADQIRAKVKQNGDRSFLITAPDLREGVTTIIANLGFYLSFYMKMDVLIIDANLRHASMHKIFKTKQKATLADMLGGDTSLEEAMEKINPHLFVLPAGKTNLNSTALLDSAKMKAIIDEANTRFDVVLIDCADLKRSQDSVILAQYVH